MELRIEFERIYAKRQCIEDINSLITLRNETGYDDEHVNDCWFYFKAALAK